MNFFRRSEPESMTDERTPLIQVVQVRPVTYRYPHHRVRRACTAVLAVVPAIVFVAFILCIVAPEVFSPENLPWSSSEVPTSWPGTNGVSNDDLEHLLTTTPDRKKAEEWSRYYTAGPHLAGKNLSQAVWTKERWQEFGIAQTEIVSYDVYVNYPAGHRLALLTKNKGKKSKDKRSENEEYHSDDWEVKYEAILEEDVLEEDPTSASPDRIPTFHGYSASGNVTAQFVYVNYGTFADFEDLQKANVSLAGKIALVKYGGIFRGLKVKRAEELGMVGAVIYSDPGDDGDVTEQNGNEAYPDGPARNPSAVQRGSVQWINILPGDPTTPGYPSKPGVPRAPANGSTPTIPSIPISYQDALPILRALNGHGPKASSFNKYWQGGGLGHQGIHYNVGPSPEDVVLNLVNEQEYVTTPMWDVIGIINGSIPDEVVILGNHRDAWIVGGAGDPNSGSAALNEVIRSFGKALEAGWKPLRTIVFASWDGEEYGLIGSTEWVEEYLPWLSQSAVAYLNVDVGTTGPNFKASAAPLLNKVLIDATLSVQSPNQTIANQTIGDVWNKHIATMGSGSDFTAFQDFAGIPCIDMGFTGGTKNPVYQYHSNYDSFAWMAKYGDPGFYYHETIARAWALLAARLVESPLLSLNATDYATALKAYTSKVEQKAKESLAFYDSRHGDVEVRHRDLFKSLLTELDRLQSAATAHDGHADELEEKLARLPDLPWYKKWYLRLKLYREIRAVNTKYKLLERDFLYETGLDGRSWFKHVVFAPGIWTGYSGATFPGIVEGIDNGDKASVGRWVEIVAQRVGEAAKRLEA